MMLILMLCFSPGFKNWLNFVLTPPDDEAQLEGENTRGNASILVTEQKACIEGTCRWENNTIKLIMIHVTVNKPVISLIYIVSGTCLLYNSNEWG